MIEASCMRQLFCFQYVHLANKILLLEILDMLSVILFLDHSVNYYKTGMQIITSQCGIPQFEILYANRVLAYIY